MTEQSGRFLAFDRKEKKIVGEFEAICGDPATIAQSPYFIGQRAVQRIQLWGFEGIVSNPAPQI
ncbi:hypothetical protein [Sulfitobacter brevis]|uniref:hypothetical protein n=1 Tax=Sulfitobacter brevis TaxID=74348 RepID=UPI000B85EFAA|nr:hypothetical protein [Sulfitobacter brevis]